MPARPESPLFLDFEASSLALDSYPIEVAWSTTDGTIESHLIRPVESWTDWSDYAEGEVHHISRETLFADGKDPSWVAARMNDSLAGQTAHSDALDFDEQWLLRLFAAAGVEPAFRLASFFDLVEPVPGEDSAGVDERVKRAHDDARSGIPARHRAAWDVEFLCEWWRRIASASDQSSG